MINGLVSMNWENLNNTILYIVEWIFSYGSCVVSSPEFLSISRRPLFTNVFLPSFPDIVSRWKHKERKEEWDSREEEEEGENLKTRHLESYLSNKSWTAMSFWNHNCISGNFSLDTITGECSLENVRVSEGAKGAVKRKKNPLLTWAMLRRGLKRRKKNTPSDKSFEPVGATIVSDT